MCDVCVVGPDLLTFLPLQASPDQKAKEVTHWLQQAYEELLEGWASTEGESYAERHQVGPPLRSRWISDQSFSITAQLLCAPPGVPHLRGVLQ